MARSKTATTDPFAMDPWRQDPWTKAMTQAFKFWVSFWPVAPLFGVEWRFADMSRTLDPMAAPQELTPRETATEVAAAPAEQEAAAEVAETVVEQAPAEPAPAAAPDDLTRIKGIGPGLARQLNDLGIRNFSQIAALSEAELAAIDEKLTSIKGRCFRDDWIGQAKALAG